MTRDKKWDVTAAGKLFLTGLNSGDYEAFVNLKRIVSGKGIMLILVLEM
jgi:hypothetical protein